MSCRLWLKIFRRIEHILFMKNFRIPFQLAPLFMPRIPSILLSLVGLVPACSCLSKCHSTWLSTICTPYISSQSLSLATLRTHSHQWMSQETLSISIISMTVTVSRWNRRRSRKDRKIFPSFRLTTNNSSRKGETWHMGNGFSLATKYRHVVTSYLTVGSRWIWHRPSSYAAIPIAFCHANAATDASTVHTTSHIRYTNNREPILLYNNYHGIIQSSLYYDFPEYY